MTIIFSNLNPNFNNIIFNKYYIITNSLLYKNIVNPLSINNSKMLNNIRKINNILL